MIIRRVVLGVAALPISISVVAGPVESYRTGPEYCPHDRAPTAPPLNESQAIERARTLLPHDFCGPNVFVSGCDADSELANGAWRVFVQQYKRSGSYKDIGGLTHTYVILDRVGNCLANIPGTELGARN
ncbi:MAG TPA: hypothetical protein VGL25_03055 [Casimicrobiaceae bacterium]